MSCTEQYCRTIAEILPFWAELSQDQQSRLLLGFNVKKYARGEFVTVCGPKKDGLILVLSGQLRVYMTADNGREISILFLKPRESFNIMTVDEAGPSDIIPQLQAIENTVIAYIARSRITPLAYCVPELAEFIFETAAKNAQGILNCIEKHLFSSLRHSVARIILEQSERERSDNIHITHEQIANHLGTTREVVSREMDHLRCAGMISTARGRIGIIDRARLSLLGIVRT